MTGGLRADQGLFENVLHDLPVGLAVLLDLVDVVAGKEVFFCTLPQPFLVFTDGQGGVACVCDPVFYMLHHLGGMAACLRELQEQPG